MNCACTTDSFCVGQSRTATSSCLEVKISTFVYVLWGVSLQVPKVSNSKDLQELKPITSKDLKLRFNFRSLLVVVFSSCRSLLCES